MGLQEQKIDVKFAGGIETKSDSKSVPSAKLLALENGVFTKAISIKKRNGYDAYTRTIVDNGTTYSNAKRLGTRDDELLLFTDNRCFSHQTDVDQWSDAGAVISVPGADQPLVKTGTQQTMPDQAELNGIRVAAWEDSLGGVYWSVVDATSGRIYRAPTQADAAGISPRCCPCGDKLHIYYAVPSTHQIMVIVVDPLTPSASSTPITLVDDLHDTNPVYDACPTSRSGTPVLIVWHVFAATSYKIGFVAPSGVLGSASTSLPSPVTQAAAMDAASPIAVAYLPGTLTNEQFAVAYTTGSNLVVTLYDPDLAPLVTSGALVATISAQRIAIAYNVPSIAVALYIAVEEAAATASERFTRVVTIDNTFTATVANLRSVGLASRAFQAGNDNDVFAYFVHDTTYFNVYLAFRLSDFACVARQIPGGATGAPTRKHLSSAHVVSDIVATALPQKERLASEANDKFGESGVRLLSLDFTDIDARLTAQLGAGLYMGGACGQHYDGRAWTEQGFHVGPETILTAPAPGGSLTFSTTYGYVVWYEWTDGQGEIHRGPVSITKIVTTGGADTQVTLTLPTLRVTKKTNVRVCVGRSKAADTGDTAEIFRVSSLDPTTAGAVNGYLANSTSVDTVTFIDRMSDTIAAAQERVYTTGGILSNDPTSLGSLIAVGNNRLFTSDMADPNSIRHSQELAVGFGAEFAPELSMKCDPFGGAVGAIAVMDDKVVIFKATAIFAFNGDGPTASGDTSTRGFSTPRLVTSDVGCSTPTSIALIPAGLMFKSDKGIYLLDRSMSVSYIGAPVEAYNGQRITRATVMPGRSQVAFLTDSGSTLLYDFLFNQWSTFTNHEGRDSAVVAGVYHYLRTDDRVFRETIGEYSDAGTRITLAFETAWLHLWEHLQGLQRFWKLLLLGTWGSPHQLGISYRTDYTDQWNEPYWLDATGGASGTGWLSGDNVAVVGIDPITGTAYGDGPYGDGPYGGVPADIYQWRMGLHVSGQAIQFRFQDFEKVGLAGATFELTEMTVIAGVEKPDTRPFAGSRSA